MRKVITILVLVLMVFTFSLGAIVSSNFFSDGDVQSYLASGNDNGTITIMDDGGPHGKPSES